MKPTMHKLLAAALAAVVSTTTLFAADDFPSWVKDLRQKNTWQTGKLTGYGKTYSSRIARDAKDYEARILHAATLLAGVAESKEAKTFLSQFGYTIKFPGLTLSGKEKPMPQWPKVNTVVDSFVKDFVPVLKSALADLEAIPEDWEGSVLIAADKYGSDEDVEVDIGDVLYARSALKALIAGAYLAQGNDVVMDWKKLSNVLENDSERKLPVLSKAPEGDAEDLLWDDSFWSQTFRMHPKYREFEGADMSVAFVGNKLYVRTVSPYRAKNGDGEDNYNESPDEPPTVYLPLWSESADKWAFLAFRKIWYWDEDDESEGYEYIFSAESDLDNKTYKDTGDWHSDIKKLALPYESAVALDDNGMKVSVFVVDFAKRKALVKADFWEMDSADVVVYEYGFHRWSVPNEDGYWDDELGEWVYFYGEWVYNEDKGYEEWIGEWEWYEKEGWFEVYCEFDDGSDGQFMEALTSSGSYSLKVRNAATLKTAKEYFRGALEDAQLADAKVMAREDDSMHFVEYDGDDDALVDLRLATEYALASLDEAVEVDFDEFSTLSFDGSPIATLIPNDGLTAVFLGALFSGQLTDSAIPQVLADREYGNPNIVVESVSDPTFAGLLPQFDIYDYLNLAENLGFGYVHAPVAIALNANGGTVKKAKIAATTATYDDDMELYMLGELPVPDARKGYSFDGWWTSASGGEKVYDYIYFEDLSFFGNPSAPTLYAHWLKVGTVTMKTAGTWAYFESPSGSEEGYVDNGKAGTKPFEVVEGWTGMIGAEPTATVGKKELTFWKWTVSPATANLGPDFDASQSEVPVTMPAENITLTAEYVDESTCGLVCGRAESDGVYLGSEEMVLDPPEGVFEWSPDGGKTWYKNEVVALVKKGSATISWRSTDSNWSVVDVSTKKLNVVAGEEYEVSAVFVYVPEVVVDIYDQEEIAATAVGTVTLNPKTGLVPVGSSITLSAKAATGYSFQGWSLAASDSEGWSYSGGFSSTAATYKLGNDKVWYGCYATDDEGSLHCTHTGSLYRYVNLDDMKVHVSAVFKANSAYSKDDIVLTGGGSEAGILQRNDDGDVTGLKVLAVVGCALDEVEVEFAAEAYPLSFKLSGKLPAGVKFDAKTGAFTGAPTKSGTYDVVVTATDPNKNSVNWPVRFDVRGMPSWLVGAWRLMDDKGYAEVSVAATGKVSVKYQNRKGSISYSGNLSWRPSFDSEEAVDEDGEGSFNYFARTKDLAECDLWFNPHEEDDDETPPFVEGYVDLYVKAENDWYGSDGRGRKLDESLLTNEFKDKYYTAAVKFREGDYEDGLYDVEGTGYAYLTVKTDKKGGAKVAGMLPDGEKLSMSGTLLPYFNEEGELEAELCLFAAPSKYKKEGHFAVKLVITADGFVFNDWEYSSYLLPSGSSRVPDVFEGAIYSAAATLEDWYFRLSGESGVPFMMEWSWKDGRDTVYEVEDDVFDGNFSVMLAGDKKGAIAVPKSPVPWKDGDEWNYETDKSGKDITNPSQVAFTFAKATGIFSGNAMAYFDYYNEKDALQHKTAKVPFNGVFVRYDEDGDVSLNGYGAGVYTAKVTEYDDDKGRFVTESVTVSLPITVEQEL